MVSFLLGGRGFCGTSVAFAEVVANNFDEHLC